MPGTAPQAGHAPAAGAAPGRLEIVRLFVNTLDIELGTDELSTPDALTSWLAVAGLLPMTSADSQPGAGLSLGEPAGGQHRAEGQPGRTARSGGRRREAEAIAATESDVRQAVALREALRGVLLSHLGTRAPAAGQPVASGAREAAGPAVSGPAVELRRIAGLIRTRLDVSDNGQVAAVPAGTGPAAALASILLIAANAAVTGTWSRLKVCGADDCRWAFYDRSPTRNGCWCSMAGCGARAKSRAYRQRAAARR